MFFEWMLMSSKDTKMLLDMSMMLATGFTSPLGCKVWMQDSECKQILPIREVAPKTSILVRLNDPSEKVQKVEDSSLCSQCSS